jgi:hypothetical protein
VQSLCYAYVWPMCVYIPPIFTLLAYVAARSVETIPHQQLSWIDRLTSSMDPLSMIGTAISLASAIDKLVATAKRNTVECQQLGRRVGRLVPVIKDLKVSISTHSSDLSASAPLQELVDALEEASMFLLSFVEEEKQGSIFTRAYRTASRAWSATDSAMSFANLNRRIDSVLNELNLLQTNRTAALLVHMKIADGDRVEERFHEDPPMESLYDKRSILGKGVFAVTHRMINFMDGRKYAVKRVDVEDAAKNGVTRASLANECAILERLTHPHVARYFLSFNSHRGLHFNIVMELIEGGTLAEKVTCIPAPTELEIVEWARQMASALSYMHGEGVLHRDLKPDNVMLTLTSKIKIIDLGLASVATSAAYMHTKVGTSTYSSFEKLTGLPYDGRDDVWAVGCILLELLTGTR